MTTSALGHVFVCFSFPESQAPRAVPSTSCVCVLSGVWLCDSTDRSLPGSSVGGICQARILDWVAISSTRRSSQSRDWTQVSCISCTGRQSLYPLTHLGSPGTYCSVQFSRLVVSDSLRPHESQHTRPPCPSPTPRVHSNSSPSSRWCPSHLILCRPLLLPPILPSIRVFSNEPTLCMRWPKYWSFSFSINPSHEHPGLVSFRMD